MSALERLNQITKIRRSQDHKSRLGYLYKQDELLANKVAYCGAWLYLREWFEHPTKDGGVGETKVINAVLCKKPFLCEVCAVRRQAKAYAKTVPVVKQVMAENPKLKPYMVTFGVKTGPDLDRQFQHFSDSRKKLRASIRRGKSEKCHDLELEWGKIQAEIRHFEVKRAAGDQTHFNFHQHSFVLSEEPLDKYKMGEEWRNASGDSFIVDVTECYSKFEDADPVESGLLEVIKYPMKFDKNLKPEDAYLCHKTLYGRQMSAKLGLFRGIKEGVLEEDAGIEEMTGEYRDHVARWLFHQQRYTLESVEDLGERLSLKNAKKVLR